VADIAQAANGELLLTFTSSLVIGETWPEAQCYGTKLTVGDQPVTLEGKTYQPGTKLTVDKDLHWIEVSSCD
jgi:hypothetical protein